MSTICFFKCRSASFSSIRVRWTYIFSGVQQTLMDINRCARVVIKKVVLFNLLPQFFFQLYIICQLTVSNLPFYNEINYLLYCRLSGSRSWVLCLFQQTFCIHVKIKMILLVIGLLSKKTHLSKTLNKNIQTHWTLNMSTFSLKCILDLVITGISRPRSLNAVTLQTETLHYRATALLWPLYNTDLSLCVFQTISLWNKF